MDVLTGFTYSRNIEHLVCFQFVSIINSGTEHSDKYTNPVCVCVSLYTYPNISLEYIHRSRIVRTKALQMSTFFFFNFYCQTAN